MWEDELDVNVKKIGWIGVQVHKDKRVDLSKATAIKVEIISNQKIIPDVFISDDARLSSLSPNVGTSEMVQIYKILKEKTKQLS